MGTFLWRATGAGNRLARLFLAIGAAGLIWLVLWLAWAPRILTSKTEVNTTGGPGWKELLRKPAVWGTCGGLFPANDSWYFVLTCLPSYLVTERHFSLNSVVYWDALPFFLIYIPVKQGPPG